MYAVLKLRSASYPVPPTSPYARVSAVMFNFTSEGAVGLLALAGLGYMWYHITNPNLKEEKQRERQQQREHELALERIRHGQRTRHHRGDPNASGLQP